MAKALEVREVTLTIKKSHLDAGRYRVLDRAHVLAKRTLGVTAVAMKSAEVTTARLSDGYNHEVLKVTWVPG